MGRRFELAKKDIESLKVEERELNAQLRKIDVSLNNIALTRANIQREWYGVADGDMLGVGAFEKIIKAAKRWAL